ncbi:MAG: glycosyltransferase family 4 protein [Gemmatimonadetes bacterium]|nr:glycosyltransferase family 4 protein [Gemmatimonadota bacterium]
MTRPLVLLTRVLPFHGSGGMQVVAWDLARSLAADGVQVTVLTTAIPGKPERFVADGVPVVAFAAAVSARYSRAWWGATRSYFRRERSAQSVAVLSVSVAAYGLLRRRGAYGLGPVALQAHGTALGEFVSKWRLRTPASMVKSVRNLAWIPVDLAMYRLCDAVVAVSERVRTDLLTPPVRWVLPADRVHLIPNGVDTSVFSPDPERRARVRAARGWTGETVIVSSSRLHPQKRIDRTLRGFQAFVSDHPHAQLVIVGEGPERGRLGALSDDLGIAHRVTFTGEMERERLPDLLRAADALLLTTSHREGLPMSVLEALAVGTPAIVSRHLHAVLAVSPSVVGVDSGDSAAIARALASLGARDGSTSLLPPSYALAVATRRYRQLLDV